MANMGALDVLPPFICGVIIARAWALIQTHHSIRMEKRNTVLLPSGLQEWKFSLWKGMLFIITEEKPIIFIFLKPLCF